MMQKPTNSKGHNVEHTEYIEASPEVIWKTISMPENLNRCHPFCKKNTMIKWEKEKSIDLIEYENGLKLKRHFTKWFEGKGYELLIGKSGTASAQVLWDIESKYDQISALSIQLEIYPEVILKKYPKIFHFFILNWYVIPKMKDYLQSVILGFKQYIESGKTVSKNEFGVNLMFSNP